MSKAILQSELADNLGNTSVLHHSPKIAYMVMIQ